MEEEAPFHGPAGQVGRGQAQKDFQPPVDLSPRHHTLLDHLSQYNTPPHPTIPTDPTSSSSTFHLPVVSPHTYGQASRRVTTELRFPSSTTITTIIPKPPTHSLVPRYTSPPEDLFFSPATCSSTLPRGALRRHPSAPYNTPVDNDHQGRRQSSPSLMGELDPLPLPQFSKVRQWVKSIENTQYTTHPEALSAPLERMALSEVSLPNTPDSTSLCTPPIISRPLPNHRAYDGYLHNVQDSHYAKSPDIRMTQDIMGQARRPTPPSPTEIDSSGDERPGPTFAVSPFGPTMSFRDEEIWREGRSSGSGIKRSREEPTSPMFDLHAPLDDLDSPEDDATYELPLKTPDRAMNKIPVKYGSPLPRKYQKRSSVDSPFGKFYIGDAGSPSPLRKR